MTARTVAALEIKVVKKTQQHTENTKKTQGPQNGAVEGGVPVPATGDCDTTGDGDGDGDDGGNGRRRGEEKARRGQRRCGDVGRGGGEADTLI